MNFLCAGRNFLIYDHDLNVQTKVITAKTHKNFITFDQFLRVLHLKRIVKILMCHRKYSRIIFEKNLFKDFLKFLFSIYRRNSGGADLECHA